MMNHPRILSWLALLLTLSFTSAKQERIPAVKRSPPPIPQSSRFRTLFGLRGGKSSSSKRILTAGGGTDPEEYWHLLGRIRGGDDPTVQGHFQIDSSYGTEASDTNLLLWNEEEREALLAVPPISVEYASGSTSLGGAPSSSALPHQPQPTSGANSEYWYLFGRLRGGEISSESCHDEP
eukprot:CAMPEP_0172459122 /NCGR_PEP_ID=MMETSP1065-20121228/31108_1 /TAXON_ID=265537 /ORGANISM="Amphiprora paludosa, Strain CCMP125" /LENGTH=178 /DNA_ID=CAMNT_0013213693 /DNA_START=13 /DNA_END=549 /DNA_ORIENTATION=-